MPATWRPFQTRFRFAFGCISLRLATNINSLAHSPKGTPSGISSLRPVVSIQFQILFHSPRRGSFHLSLTVLLRYRSSSVFRLGQWTAQFHTELACSVLLRILPFHFISLYGTLTLFGLASQPVPIRFRFFYEVLQPHYTSAMVWPTPLSLATTRRIISFPRAT